MSKYANYSEMVQAEIDRKQERRHKMDDLPLDGGNRNQVIASKAALTREINIMIKYVALQRKKFGENW